MAHPQGPVTSRDRQRAHRVIASLNREQVDYLDRLGKDAQCSSGVQLFRTHEQRILLSFAKYSDSLHQDFAKLNRSSRSSMVEFRNAQ